MDGNLVADTTQWVAGKDYPEWMDEVGVATISKGYLLPDETPKKAYRRVAKAIAERINRPDLESKFFRYIWNGWIGLASPVLSNTGTDRGLPISCFGIDTPDSIRGIGLTNAELMKLTALGGGVGISVSRIRPRGTEIRGNGKSEGVVPWCKIYDSAIIATNQGSVRRGAASVNLDINHIDINEFMQIRRPKGDPNRQCLNLHQCVVVDDAFMRRLQDRDGDAMKLWLEILKTRVETGEPYIMFKDNVNKNNPLAYAMNNLDVSMTNICTEITLHTDEEHSFICCLSSLNLAKYDEWKDTDVVETATRFLDGVMQEFIDKSNGKDSLIRTHRHAQKGRALGLGVLGWHTYLQQKGFPFEGLLAQYETRRIFSQIKIESERASMALAETFGEPLWCVGTGMRNTHLRAIAPTVSNSKLSGNISPGIEPWAANVFTDQSAKGTFIRRNPTLEATLKEHNLNTNKVWNQILKDGGSVQDIKELDKIMVGPDKDIPIKEVYKTFKEINQLDLVNQAGIRQQYIDQAVSLNLAFPAQADPKFINKVHLEAWKKGIKTLYYMRTESVLRGDIAEQAMQESCLSCDG